MARLTTPPGRSATAREATNGVYMVRRKEMWAVLVSDEHIYNSNCIMTSHVICSGKKFKRLTELSITYSPVVFTGAWTTSLSKVSIPPESRSGTTGGS
jgi:hypothetical protein